MAIPLETVVKQLTDSGIITPGKLENYIPPKASPADGESLLRELYKQNLLTKFQAQQFAQGRPKSLILGNYTLLDKIGAGGMGQVFKAEHRRMKRVVAIKMLPKAMLKDVAAAARFQREVEAAAKLSHPNIVHANDADESNGVHFLVMEYVEGSDLSALVKKDGPLSVAKAVNYTLQAAKGLEFAHKKGVIHRDIKPANLLLDNEGVVKILDMGLARISGDGNTAAQAELTGTGAVMGTVDYMAPEQGLSTKHADARADIYSLGCSLHYLLIGKPTFDGETITAKLLAHHNAPLPNLCQLRSDVPKPLQAVFAKMIAKKLEDRYQTMTEVIVDLEKCQAGLSSSTASATVTTSASSDTQESEMTAAFASRRLQSIPAVEKYVEPEGKGPPWKNTKLLIGAGAAGFLFLLLGVIVIVRNKDGKEVVRLDVPDGNSVEVQPTPVNATTAKPITTFKEPAFQQWMKEVQAMPAEQQIEAVSKKLVELNPGFDGKVLGGYGKVTPKIENGAVTEIAFFTDKVTDISPLRALGGLKLLECSGSDQGKLSDLSPLQGLLLSSLHCGRNPVADLSPLAGMPLTNLIFYNTHVSDLSPLKGIKLKSLYCNTTAVYDLSPLTGMPLTNLVCSGTKISNLLPLAGMPLEALRCDGTEVSDLSPLQECKSMINLTITKTKVTAAGVAALQKALPNCKIEWDDPAKPAAATSPAPAGPAPPPAKAPFDAPQAQAHQAAWATHLGTKVETVNSAGMKMILIPPGEFLMGSSDEQVAAALKAAEEGIKDHIEKTERPQHRVVITKPFLMGATEVTVGQFKKFAAATGYQTEAEKAEVAAKAAPPLAPAPGQPATAASKTVLSYLNPGYAITDESPAAVITWNDACAFCNWLSEQDQLAPCYRSDGSGSWFAAAKGNGYRLPTEAQWEYACRAGTTTHYSFGDDYQELGVYGWYNKNSGARARPVGLKPANAFGLHDMHGNMWEWCQDFGDDKWYEKSPLNDPNGPDSGSTRMVRGGDWYGNASTCRNAYRSNYPPSGRISSYGFRCVRAW